MRYNKVLIEGFAAELPPHTLSSLELEERLAPTYQRLNLSSGRLDLFTGIKERRYWDLGTKPSDVATMAAKKLMAKLNLDGGDIDLLIHCSVCRDFLEPGTASVVHSNLDLPPTCNNFDISNACLGLISGIEVASAMVEAGLIRRALLVSGEIGYPLLCETVAHLNARKDLTRRSFKPHFASLTIGSCAAAVCVSAESVASEGHRLVASKSYANTVENHLCQGDSHGESGPLMETDSEELLIKGVETASMAWQLFLSELGRDARDYSKFCTHQVGSGHTALLFKSLGLDLSKDFLTFPFLGNCGSASLPATVALADEAGHFTKGDRVGLLGIGSGINCSILELEW